ncbi:MAG TPA: RNB domain-containing ribonuclease [Miltoncostaeaceae bacterium]|nr:RNB domain-containing ribonuclease [Miltoncostaeaceae bacterium]
MADGFPAPVAAAAVTAARRGPRADLGGRADHRDMPFVSIDPAGARDLDQALHLSRAGDGFTVRYAIADVAAFVHPGDAVDREACARGETLYGADGNLPLHPPALSEGAASLLEGQDRPAILWTLTIDCDGELHDVALERTLVRNRVQLSYEQAQERIVAGEAAGEGQEGGLGLLPDIGECLLAAEARRGGVSLPQSEQVVRVRDGRWSLAFRRLLAVERWNAQLSLLCGMAAARLMVAGGIGVLRTLPAPAPEAIARLRRTARALGVVWPAETTYPQMVHTLDPSRPAHAAMVAAASHLLRGSGYTAFLDGAPAQAEHAGLATHYAHVTAPLRRLVDRHGLEVCLALVGRRPVPEWVRARLEELPQLMRASGRRAGAYESAVINLVEAAVLEPHVGERFRGVVVDRDARRPHRGEAVIAEPAVSARVDGDDDLPLGSEQELLLSEADPATRRVRFRWEG